MYTKGFCDLYGIFVDDNFVARYQIYKYLQTLIGPGSWIVNLLTKYVQQKLILMGNTYLTLNILAMISIIIIFTAEFLYCCLCT